MENEARKEAAKAEIAKLIDEFEKNRDYYDKTDEANIETKLIEPMFAALGWTKDDFEKREKVKRKDRRGITDYMFKLRGKSVFVLEAKKVEVEVEWDEVTWKQAISYTFSNKVRFSVLTNFKNLLIFCTDDEKAMSPFRVLKYTEYLSSRFEDLWLISKDGFKQNLIFERATNEGRMKKRRTIDDELLEGLLSSRKKIVESIEQNYGGKYTTLEKDDIAQRIFGRLIFMRKCEDKQINFDKNGKEIEMLKEVTALPHNEAYPKLKKIFTKYNDVFDSGLFMKEADSDADRIEIYGKVIKELVDSTYESKDGNYVYNFEWIDADILGNIYEQYLGHILKETTKQTRIKESHAHRKEQGIYYTPTDIVKYIVDNTLGEILKEKKPEEIKKLRVLDPACGSGSFLIKGFDILEDYYEKNIGGQSKFHSSGDFYSIKEQVLTNNIFGVDLDHMAVEIAQLNLLLKLAEKGHRLPLLEKNIQNGNSLIDDEAIAGDNAFKWQERFPNIIQFDEKDQLKDGYGFDVIIGNPPYGVQFDKKEREYFKIKYPYRDKDINSFVLFVERAIGLIKKDGYLAFIIPKNFIKTDDYEKIRNLVLRNTSLCIVADFGKKFAEVTGEMVVIILKKRINKNNNTRIEIYDADLNVETTQVEQKKFLEFDKSRINLTSSTKTGYLVEKVRGNSIKIENFLKIIRGVETGKKDNYISLERKSNRVPIVAGKDIDRYIVKSLRYMEYLPDKINFKDESVYKKPKILIRKIASHIHATYDTSGIYTTQGVYCLYGKSERELKGVLGIINSKLLRWYYDFYFNMGSHLTTNVTIENVRNLYVKEKVPNELIVLVDRMLTLNKKLSEFGNKNTPETVRLKNKIQKTDAEIDDLVYKLYGITESEKKIIEESLR